LSAPIPLNRMADPSASGIAFLGSDTRFIIPFTVF